MKRILTVIGACILALLAACTSQEVTVPPTETTGNSTAAMTTDTSLHTEPSADNELDFEELDPSVESTQPESTPGVAPPSGPTQPTKPAETTEPVETTKPVETTEPVETTKPAETTKPVETTEPAETTKPVETTESTEPSQKPTETTVPTEPATDPDGYYNQIVRP